MKINKTIPDKVTKINKCFLIKPISIIILMVIVVPVYPQKNIQLPTNRLPEQTLRFDNAYYLINPATIGIKSRGSLNTGYTTFSRFSGLRTMIASADFRLASSYRKNNDSLAPERFHQLGFHVYYNEEGQNFNRGQLNINYAVHIPLSPEITLAGGITASLVNYSIESTVTNGGSAFVGDGTVGLWLYSNKFYTGVALNSIANSHLTPIIETTKLVRHINFTAGKTIDLNPYMEFGLDACLRWAPVMNDPRIGDKSMVSLLSELSFYKKFNIALGYVRNQEILFSTSFENLKMGQNHLNIVLAYGLPVRKERVNNEVFEIIIGYLF